MREALAAAEFRHLFPHDFLATHRQPTQFRSGQCSAYGLFRARPPASNSRTSSTDEFLDDFVLTAVANRSGAGRFPAPTRKGSRMQDVLAYLCLPLRITTRRWDLHRLPPALPHTVPEREPSYSTRAREYQRDLRKKYFAIGAKISAFCEAPAGAIVLPRVESDSCSRTLLGFKFCWRLNFHSHAMHRRSGAAAGKRIAQHDFPCQLRPIILEHDFCWRT